MGKPCVIQYRVDNVIRCLVPAVNVPCFPPGMVHTGKMHHLMGDKPLGFREGQLVDKCRVVSHHHAIRVSRIHAFILDQLHSQGQAPEKRMIEHKLCSCLGQFVHATSTYPAMASITSWALPTAFFLSFLFLRNWSGEYAQRLSSILRRIWSSWGSSLMLSRGRISVILTILPTRLSRNIASGSDKRSTMCDTTSYNRFHRSWVAAAWACSMRFSMSRLMASTSSLPRLTLKSSDMGTGVIMVRKANLSRISEGSG